jgi:hypothetical protein
VTWSSVALRSVGVVHPPSPATVSAPTHASSDRRLLEGIDSGVLDDDI